MLHNDKRISNVWNIANWINPFWYHKKCNKKAKNGRIFGVHTCGWSIVMIYSVMNPV